MVREDRLVDIGGGILRKNRILVQEARGAVLFLGLGKHDEQPFDHMTIAEVLAKAGYDPNEPRDERGRWTGGARDAAREGQADAVPEAGFELAAAHIDDTQAKKERFVDAHLADAQKGADELGVPVENILGLSALESGWGNGDFTAARGKRPAGNNYFGIQYPAPFATGYIKARRSRAKVATFASYTDSLRSFISESGDIVRGIRDPEAFARALQDSGKFGIETETGLKVPAYVPNTARTIRGLRPLIARRSI